MILSHHNLKQHTFSLTMFAEFGIGHEIVTLNPDTIYPSDIKDIIHPIGSRVIFQTPIPRRAKNVIDQAFFEESKFPAYDIDRMGNHFHGLLYSTKSHNVAPTTADAVYTILNWYNVSLVGKDVVVIGRSDMVGNAVAQVLMGKDATVTVCHSKTLNLADKLKRADIVITAAGVPNLVKARDLKPGVAVIDVSISFDENGKICGDCVKPGISEDSIDMITHRYTPVPNGVGPVTRALLIKNALGMRGDVFDIRDGNGNLTGKTYRIIPINEENCGNM